LFKEDYERDEGGTTAELAVFMKLFAILGETVCTKLNKILVTDF
jgi:hypothetical protein